MLSTLSEEEVAVAQQSEPNFADRVLENPVFRWLNRRAAPNRAKIFMLHRFRDPELGVHGYDVEHLRRALGALKRERVRMLSLRDLVRQVRSREPLGEPAAVFTVDDGYVDFGRMAAPVFAEFGCPVTVFVSTEVVAGRMWYWWDRVSYAVLRSPRSSLRFALPDGPAMRIDLDDPRQRVAAVEKLTERLKAYREADRHPLLEELAVAADVQIPRDPPPESRVLNWDEVLRLERDGVEFGPHSRTHPILSREDDGRAREEIHGSWTELQERCRNPSPVFCYPNGTRETYSAREMQIIRDAGMEGAVVFEEGAIDPLHYPSEELMQLPRRVLPTRPERTPVAVTGVLRIPTHLTRWSEQVTSAPPVTPRSTAAVSEEAPAASGSIGRGAAWYTLAILIMRSVSVIMLPVYTRFLTPKDYGALQMLGMVSDIATILLVAGMTAGVQRFYFKAKTDAERGAVVSTAFFLEVGLAMFGSLLLLIFAPVVSARMLGIEGGVTLVQVVAADFTLGMLSAVPMLYLQTLRRARQFAAAAMVRLMIQVSLNLLFVVGMGWGVYGMLVSTLTANALVGAYMSIWMLRQTGARIDRTVLRDLRRFGIPHQITFAGAFIITFGDRFFLQSSAGLAAVGLYGLAYQFGFLLAQVGALPFLNAWNPIRYQMIGEPREVRDAAFSRSFFYFNVLLLGASVGLGVFIQPALTILTTAQFRDAAYVVPIVLFAYVFQSWMDVVKFGIDATERTKYHAYGTWISVVVTVGLYATLIPPFGVYGAAFATLLGFFVRFLLALYWSHRCWPVAYGWRRVTEMTLTAVALIGAYYVLLPEGMVRQIGTGVVLLTAFFAMVFLVLASNQDREVIVRAMKSPRAALAGLVKA